MLEKSKIRVRLPTWLEEEELKREDEEIRRNERLREIEAQKDERDREKILKLKKKFFLEPHVIPASDLEKKFENTQQEKSESDVKLRKKLNQLLYLRNLEKTYVMEDGAVNEDPCPICFEKLGYEWYIVSCGHLYCVVCVNGLLKACEKRNYLRCASCRELCLHSESFMVSTLINNANNKQKVINETNIDALDKTKDEFSDIHISGSSNSAKVEGVVKCLLKIIGNEKKAKCIVFSEHFVILDLIISLLNSNSISYRCVRGVKSQKPIDTFKLDDSVNVLLMLYNHGANGLNLTEATHVLLVEPTLDKSQEIQAIGILI
jgi:E3 ubiquitin-protein ligase SHPRH